MTGPARIVLLNGAGSSGKTAIAKALQTMTAEPFLHVQMDDFLAMMPEHLQDHRDGFAYQTTSDGVVITSGPIGKRTLRGMRHAIAALAREGNDLIVDDVMLGGEAEDYARLLADFMVHRVGIFAPLDVLEARERQRGDRLAGLARWQYDRVHENMNYDLEIDTSKATPIECARRIKDRFGL